MKTVVLAVAFLASIAAAPAGAVDATPSHTVVTRLGVSTTEFSCSVNGGQECHYLILHVLCNERFLAPGQKERTCTYTEAAPPFRIRSGERKKITGLAADYLYTMKVGVAPTVQDVLNRPVKH